MLISDWSSDVCSSDLIGGPAMAKWNAGAVRPLRRPRPCPRFQQGNNIVGDGLINVGARGGGFAVLREFPSHVPFPFQMKPKACAPSASAVRRAGPGNGAWRAGRSEEHTPELQSLMRTPYAVFCMKNINITT